jgi:hypothetical protein
MQELEIESFLAKNKLWGKIPEMLITIKIHYKSMWRQKGAHLLLHQILRKNTLAVSI